MSVSLLNQAVVGALRYVPKPVVWRVSRRYIAGTALEDGLRTIGRLNGEGMVATLDVLGEDVREVAQVAFYRDIYLRALDQLAGRRLDGNVSVKLTEMGLRCDESLCRHTMEALASAAQGHGNSLRVDMEDSSVTDVTLDIYRTLRESHQSVGCVLQACLRRSEADAQALLDDGIANVRVCKGIYVEPPEIAYQGREEIRDSFRRLIDMLIEGGAERVAIATHDPPVLEHALGTLARHGNPGGAHEFQMLLGVGGALRPQVLEAGHRLRIYVPFGEHWFAYSLRRLRENPAIAGHIIRNLGRR